VIQPVMPRPSRGSLILLCGQSALSPPHLQGALRRRRLVEGVIRFNVTAALARAFRQRSVGGLAGTAGCSDSVPNVESKPSYKSGMELHSRLVESGRAIPIILITAYPHDGVQARAMADGVICYLTKPCDEDALHGCVHSALKRIKQDEDA
jgi:ActR/RegA family two-component response regulator